VDRTFVIVKPDGVERRLIGEIVGRLERGRDMAVDLGTANTLVYVRGRASSSTSPRSSRST
jgi:actin-like ATPase involved in cell morphogenesis